LIAESFVKFSREVSIIAVRGQDGDVKTWALAENHHHNGICHTRLFLHQIAQIYNQLHKTILLGC
jgi:phosphoribosylaminoimidazole carboxylase (NCAIR synthetase)